jgi:hypothetical protein
MPRHLAIADETIFGTPVTPPTTFLDVRSIGLHPEREFISAPSMIYSGPRYMAPGPYKCVGDIALYASADNLMKLFYHMFGGTPVSAQDGTTGNYAHLFLPSDTLKWGTYYKIPDVCATITSAHQFTSCIPTSMRIETRTGDPVSVTFSMLAQKDAKVAATALGTVSTVRPFFSIDGKIFADQPAQGAELANIDSISMTYTRKIPDDEYAMTDYLLKCFVPGEGTLEGEMDMLFTDWEAHGYFWSGVKTDTAPIQAPAPVALDLDFNGDALPTPAVLLKYRCRILCPKIVVTSVDMPVELRNKVMQTVSFKGYQGTVSGATALLSATLQNRIVSV